MNRVRSAFGWPDGMNIEINLGEVRCMEDLLNALLIRSANESANIISENLVPTRKDFVAKSLQAI